MLRPLGDRVVVKAVELSEVTASGIVLPDSAKEKPHQGTILAIGQGYIENGTRVPLEVKVGDHVIYSQFSGTEIKYEDEDYLILRESDILAVIEAK